MRCTNVRRCYPFSMIFIFIKRDIKHDFFPVYPAPLPDIFQKIFSQKGIKLHFAQQHLFLVKKKSYVLEPSLSSNWYLRLDYGYPCLLTIMDKI